MSSTIELRLEYTDSSETYFNVLNLRGSYFKYKNTIRDTYNGKWNNIKSAWMVSSKYLEDVAELLGLDEVFEAEEKTKYPRPPELDYKLFIIPANTGKSFWVKGAGLHEEYQGYEDDSIITVKEGLINTFDGKFSSFNHGISIKNEHLKDVKKWLGSQNIETDPEKYTDYDKEDTKAYKFCVTMFNQNIEDLFHKHGMGAEELKYYFDRYISHMKKRTVFYE